MKLLSTKKLLAEAKPWGVKKEFWKGKWHQDGGYTKQRTDPEPENILKILGIKKNEKVLVVAGHKATWALALAKGGAQITYSDISAELRDFVKHKVKHQNIKKYLAKDFVEYPKAKEYDWTFTFEAVGPKEFIFFRSVLNNKGGIYVLWNNKKHTKNKLKSLTNALTICKKYYSCRFKIAEKNILCVTRDGPRRYRKHTIVKLVTNNKARKLMQEDLAAIQNKKITSNNSRKRIEKISALFDTKFTEKYNE